MTVPKSHSQPCHNCRRQRWKCDRSIPHCVKCITKGQECLGYHRLFRWEQGIASRGKMAGKTFGEVAEDRAHYQASSLGSLSPTKSATYRASSGNMKVSPLRPVMDPSIQDLNRASRRYLSYFADVVCRDFVLYDIPSHNPFRELIPLTFQHPMLLQIIIATSALHMSNACQKFLDLDTLGSCFSYRSSPSSSSTSSSSVMQHTESYSDALIAKQRALCLLNSTLARIASVNIDVTLAVVLLFIEFELMDSGKDNWKHHVVGARTIINTLCGPNVLTQTTMSPLRSCLISNCLVFDILGSTFTCSVGFNSSNAVLSGPPSLLRDAEGNHCSSFPIMLLKLVQNGAQLLYSTQTSSNIDSSSSAKQQQAALLLSTAQSFDPLAWATNLQLQLHADDLVLRTHIGCAHRAAVCIYLSRVELSFCLEEPSDSLEILVADVVNHLSFVHPKDELFKAIMWPAFIAGAETNDEASQKWVIEKFQELWEIEPWGLIRGALGVLERIWLKRSEAVIHGKQASMNWIEELRASGVDWLIL